MIRNNGIDTAVIYYMGKAIDVVYRRGKLLWQAVRSCFGAGYWVGEKPWLGNEPWKG